MPNKWITHVMQYHKDHPNISYKEAMKDAKASYKKTQKGKGGCMSRSAEVAPDAADPDDGPRHLNREQRETIFEPTPRNINRQRRQSLLESGLAIDTAAAVAVAAPAANVRSHNARVKMLLTKSGLM